MSVSRSPIRKTYPNTLVDNMTGSQPDLSKIKEIGDGNISFRKRKERSFEDDIKDELKSFKEFLNEFSRNQNEKLNMLCGEINSMKTQINEVKISNELLHQENNNLKIQIEQLNKKTDSSINKIHSLETDLGKINILENEITVANNTISELTYKLQIKEQHERINNLEITGVPMMKNENLYNILNNIGVKVGFPILPTDVDYIHRVRRYSQSNTTTNTTNNNRNELNTTPLHSIPNIIVKFTQRKRKSDLLAAVRARRGLTTADVGIDGPSRPIYVNDHLTPNNKVLYRRARQIIREKGYKYIWLNEGRILARKSDTSKVILIANEIDLNKIK